MDIKASIEARMKEAREFGALFHVTNPADAWFCTECQVFGKGGTECWSCGSTKVKFHWVPRWGGGSQSHNPSEEIQAPSGN